MKNNTHLAGYRADPDQKVLLQVDDKIGFWITVNAFHEIARQQAHTNNN
ncbi:hypothetical protein L5G28_16345 [Gordonia sp. HY285]|nr:hypothetical protein [Gordonia liuliyuniae]MCF8611717.1 hypothetical protein [Gordonia liuliyuniae]